MSIEIKEVRTKSEMKKFVRFVTNLYKGNPYYCPPLEFDEFATLNPKKNPVYEFSESVCYLAYRDGKLAGRICGIVNHRANEQWKVKKLRFAWFDFIDDLEVSSALLDAVAQWGKSKGMETMNGPVGFTDFDHQGLMLEGYEYNSPMASLYNHPYYVKHFDAYGFEKEADWIEYLITPPAEVPERMERIAKIVLDKYKLRVDKVHSVKELKRKYGYSYMDTLDEAYKPLYNYSPMTDRQKKYFANAYFGFINFDFATMVVNEQNEIVGVGVGMPNISDALRKSHGRMFPFGWYRLLKALKAKKMEEFDLLLIGVRPDYQNKGVNSIFFYDQIPYFVKYGIKKVCTTSILESNSKNQANYEYFEKIQHKRRRAYIKPL
ncbi:MAG: N-acetyltransferase [Paludibacter sp.]|jgi:GNAT superfamily N-acetyltransferase|nr:N-acetyltransferase [Paludibacter sp.]